jgi:hypothetical protein
MLLLLANIVGRLLDNMAFRSSRQFPPVGNVGDADRAVRLLLRSGKGEQRERTTGKTKWSPGEYCGSNASSEQGGSRANTSGPQHADP